MIVKKGFVNSRDLTVILSQFQDCSFEKMSTKYQIKLLKMSN